MYISIMIIGNVNNNGIGNFYKFVKANMIGVCVRVEYAHVNRTVTKSTVTSRITTPINSRGCVCVCI